jgi:hypothetical protein
VLTAPGQGIREDATRPLSLSNLIATLARLARLTAALEDLAHYCGPARLTQSWGRIGELLIEAEQLAHAGARLLSARLGDHPDVTITGLVARLTEAGRDVDEHAVGSARWWLAVHRLRQRAEATHRLLARLTAGPSPGGQRPLWPG